MFILILSFYVLILVYPYILCVNILTLLSFLTQITPTNFRVGKPAAGALTNQANLRNLSYFYTKIHVIIAKRCYT